MEEWTISIYYLLISALALAGCTSTRLVASTSAQAVVVDHKAAYNPKPERGPHIDIKVTPPEIRGQDGRVLIEVYNRSKDHLGSVNFDVKLKNNEGFEIEAPITASDLKPNMSGGQWVKIPPIKGRFPKIIAARALNIRVIRVDATEIKLKAFMDLIKY